MAIQLGHAEDGSRYDGMDARIQSEQVSPVGNERLQVLWLREIEPAGQTGQDHAQAEGVRQRVMVLHLMLPGHVAGQIDGACDL